MAITIYCGNHTPKLKLTLADDRAGGSLPCPKCGSTLQIPVQPPSPSNPPRADSKSAPVEAAAPWPTLPSQPRAHQQRKDKQAFSRLLIGVGLILLVAGCVLGVFLSTRFANRPEVVAQPERRDGGKASEGTVAPSAPVVPSGTPSATGPTPAPPTPVPFAPSPAALTLEGRIRVVARDLKDPQPEKRIKALETLATYGPDAEIVGAEIIEAMRIGPQAVRDAASEAFEKINPKVHAHVFTIIRGTNKANAVQSLARMRRLAKVAVPLLHQCAESPSDFGLLHIGAEYRVDLIEFDVLRRTFAQRFVIDAIIEIDPADGKINDVILSTIRQKLTSSDHAGISERIWALQRLHKIGAPATDKIKALVTALDDGVGSPLVIDALAGFGREAAPALPMLKKLKLSPDDNVRAKAAAAIARIE